ncbi:MAG: helix-turn-helix domain-containing protein [Desulfobacterales bacterium]|nr:helix-turn-helix domain-containing protein [Desulfobacterales bacterium]
MATINILAVEGALFSNITGFCDALYIANLWHQELTGSKERLFNTRILTMDGNPVNACGGIRIEPQGSIGDAGPCDYAIVSPQLPHKTQMPEGMDRLGLWLDGLTDCGTTVASVCTGAFILAETGLLDQRKATTNWQFARMFRRRYPTVDLQADQMLVRDGSFITTGAVTALYNLILYMVQDLGSQALASVVSKALLIDHNRRDQTPYSRFMPARGHNDDQIKAAQTYIENDFSNIESIEEIAREVGVSPRHFIRRFKKATGDPPLKYLQQVRIEKAKEKLETTRETVENITWAVGYKDLSSFGRLFKQYTGLSPKVYRDRFSPHS